MNNTGLKLKKRNDPRDVFISELEMKSSQEKVRWGMSDEALAKLTKKNQKNTPKCVAYTASSLYEGVTGEIYSADYPYTNTDKIYENSNRGGLYTPNVYRFMKDFGLVLEEHAPTNPDANLEEQYKNTLWIDNKHKKYKIEAFVRIDNKLSSLKQALDNLDMISIDVFNFRTRWTHESGKWMRRFYYDESAGNAHAMKVAYLEKKKGKHYVYVWNSWGRGLAMFVLEDFPKSRLDFYGVTVKKALGKKIVKKVEQKKKVLPQYQYFQAHEVYKLKPELVRMLDKARGYAGIPFVITSGYRSKAHNKRVGGVPNSAHTKGLAVDLRARTSKDRFTIISALIKAGFSRIGIGRTFIHADIDSSKSAQVAWLY